MWENVDRSKEKLSLLSLSKNSFPSEYCVDYGDYMRFTEIRVAVKMIWFKKFARYEAMIVHSNR